MAKRDYYLGLDIGTDSVGFCVTDREYNIIAKRAVRLDRKGQRCYTKKHLWGARLFSEAEAAAERRSHRAARRRLQRRRWRLLLLQEIFKLEVEKVDPFFFDRLNNSFLHAEDKPDQIQDMPLLFPEIKHGDALFKKKYPTIYHLRQALLTQDRRFDIREIYLAFAHMVKYRGNFLREGDIKSGGTDIDALQKSFDILDKLIESLYIDTDEGISPSKFNLDKSKAESLDTCFKESLGKAPLRDKEAELFGIPKKRSDIRSNILDLINGSTKKITDLFPELEEEDEFKDKKICFEDDDFETGFADLCSALADDDKINLILETKNIHDYRVLASLLQGKSNLSEAMVATYEKHKKQLKTLKRLIKKYAGDHYNAFFRISRPEGAKEASKNYVNYIAFNKKKGEKEKGLSHSTSLEELGKEIKKLLPSIENADENDRFDIENINREIDAGTYLPRQNGKNNGILPYQLNYNEMKAIIDIQKKYYPFLGELDSDFINPNEKCYKLLSLISFKIPYYVGPLSDGGDSEEKRPENHWMVRKKDGVKITPWNFHEVIDKAASEKEFIDRMKNKCTYLLGECTLPKNSLLYSRFMLLNEMNNWLINGKKITEDDKNYLIQNVYLATRSVKKKNIIDALVRKYGAASGDEISLQTRKGSDLSEEDMHANLGVWIDMMDDRAFGRALLKDKALQEKAEQVLFDLTMFEDNDVRKERLEALELSKSQVRYLLSRRYKGWGKLSGKILDELTSPAVNPLTDEVLEKDMTVIELMSHYPLNFMEIYETENHYTFKKQVETENDRHKPNEEDLIDSEYVSPAMKRSLRQTLKVVSELKKILRIDGFLSYFVECTREQSKTKQRTLSRRRKLEEIYKACKIESEDKELFDSLSQKDDDQLKKDKLFLYFLQLGKSVYTGKPIDLDNLSNYDIDHIIPQAKLKDDSIDNRVLVERDLNSKKSDTYPLPCEIITPEGRRHIEFLYSKISGKEHVLLSSEKRRRLLRSVHNQLTEDELVGFVNRQLVTTSQSVKAVCDILKYVDKGAHIVYSKATNVSGFRKTFDLVKCRDVNNFHHAHDAYLNIVVGNVYNKVFSSSFDVETLRRQREYFEGTKIDPEHFFKQDRCIPGTPVWVWKAKKYLDKQKTKEDPNSKGTIDLIRQNLLLDDPMITRMPYTQPGIMRKASIRSTRWKGKADLPLKAEGPLSEENYALKYGGYSDLTAPFFMLVRSVDKKGKHQYSLENIPAVYKDKIKDEQFVKEYLEKNLSLKEPEVILPEVKIKTLLEFTDKETGRARILINAKTESRLVGSIASPLVLPQNYVQYVKNISVLLGTNLPAGQKKPDFDKLPDNNDPIKVGSHYLDKETNLRFFEYLCDDVFNRSCFKFVPGVSSTLREIKSKKDIFTELSVKKQIFILQQIISLLQDQNAKANLLYMNLNKQSGNLSFSKIMSAKTRIIAQSVTGFYEKVLFTVPED